jgi:CRISPR type I-E-associated protein CasA/Cse1
MELSFNLLDEKWIQCIDKDKKIVLLNLRETVTEAHNLTGLAADLPIVNASLFLFLLAFTSSANRLKNLDEWDALHSQGNFPKEVTEQYAKVWHDRFDLLDKEHPFYQDPKIGKRAKDLKKLKNGQSPVAKSLSGLLLHISSGSNATLFEHSMDAAEKWYSMEEAARILVMLQSYSLGGMSSASIGDDKYYKDSPFSRGITFLCRGDNLFESLLQNMIPEEKDIFSQGKQDRPCWEAEDPFEKDSGIPKGLIDLLTWQSRRMHLIPETVDESICVRYCFSAPGLPLVETFANPYYLNQHEVKKGETTFRPLRFRTSGVIWRDSGVILDKQRSFSDKPVTKILFEDLKAEGILESPRIRLDLYGMCTEPGQKKVYFYEHERFDAPAVYLEKPELFQAFSDALNLAEAIRSALYSATMVMASYKIYPEQDVNEGMKPDKKMVAALYEHINMERRFWGSLETKFYRMMNLLPETEEALDEWKLALLSAARESLAAAADLAGDDVTSLKARAKAEMRLGYKLNEALKPNPEEA